MSQALGLVETRGPHEDVEGVLTTRGTRRGPPIRLPRRSGLKTSLHRAR